MRRTSPKYVMMPAHCQSASHPVVEDRMRRLAQYAETCDLNRVEMGDTKLGIITSGTSYQYVKEVFGEEASVPQAGHGPPYARGTDPGLRRQGGPTGGGGGAGPHHREPLPSAGPDRYPARRPCPWSGEFSQNLVAAKLGGAVHTGTALEDAIPSGPPVMCCRLSSPRTVLHPGKKQVYRAAATSAATPWGRSAPLNAMEMTCSAWAPPSAASTASTRHWGRKARGRRWPSSETPPSCTLA